MAYCYRSSVVCVLSVGLLLSVGHHNRELHKKTIKVSLRAWTRVVPGNHVLVEARITRGWGIFGSISLHIVKYREYSACCRYYQPYLVGGSSDACGLSQAVLQQLVTPDGSTK